MIGEQAMHVDAPLAMEYLHKALDARQNPGLVHLLLGILEDQQDNSHASKKHFAEAKRIAHQAKDEELAMRVKMSKDLFGGFEGGLLRRLLEMGGPAALEDLLEEFEEESNDD